MPRTYVRKTARASYTEETLKEALQKVAHGSSLKSVEKEYGISSRTLRRHRDGNVKNPGSIKLGYFTPDLSNEQEKELVLHIQIMEKRLFGLTTKDLQRLAFEFAEQLKAKHRFNMETKMAGVDWLSGFLVRHPMLSIRKPEPMNICRAVGFNEVQVDRFFSEYREILEAHSYSDAHVWNMDESGISCVQVPHKVVATKGARDVGKMTSGERGKNVTIICCNNAAGMYLPQL